MRVPLDKDYYISQISTLANDSHSKALLRARTSKQASLRSLGLNEPGSYCKNKGYKRPRIKYQCTEYKTCKYDISGISVGLANIISGMPDRLTY